MLLVRDTIRLIGEIPVQSEGALQKKLALTFLLGGLEGEFGNGIFWARFMISFLHNDRHIQYGDKCSVLP